VEIELPDELSMLRDMVRRFVDGELIPIEGKSLDGQRLKPEIEARLTARCKELGLWQIDVPKELGGQGLGVLGRSIVWSELGRTVALPTRVVRILGPDIRAPLYALEGEMRERYLMPAIRGERESCFAQTEPDAGSDPGAISLDISGFKNPLAGQFSLESSTTDLTVHYSAVPEPSAVFVLALLASTARRRGRNL